MSCSHSGPLHDLRITPPKSCRLSGGGATIFLPMLRALEILDDLLQHAAIVIVAHRHVEAHPVGARHERMNHKGPARVFNSESECFAALSVASISASADEGK